MLYFYGFRLNQWIYKTTGATRFGSEVYDIIYKERGLTLT